MSRYLADRIERDPRIEVRLRTVVRELLGEGAMAVRLVHEYLDAVGS